MQLIRRLPKRGFSPVERDDYQVVNVESLNRFGANAVVGPAELKAAGLVTSVRRRIKILGDGDLTKIVTVRAHAISKSADKKITVAGATFERIVVSKVEERMTERRARRLAEMARERAEEAKRRAAALQQKDQEPKEKAAKKPPKGQEQKQKGQQGQQQKGQEQKQKGHQPPQQKGPGPKEAPAKTGEAKDQRAAVPESPAPQQAAKPKEEPPSPAKA